MSAAVLSRKKPNTVKHGYSEHIYNKLTLTAKLFSFPVTILHFANLTDKTNCTLMIKSIRPSLALRYKHVVL